MAKTTMMHFRVTPKEKQALYNYAEQRGVTATAILLRSMREIISIGPSFFNDERKELSKMRRELSAIGNNLNQIARRINSGECKADPLTTEEIKTLHAKIREVSGLYQVIMANAKKRRIVLRKAVRKTE